MIAIFPEISACAARGDMEALAVLARRYFGAGGGRSPVVDVEDLLRDAGVMIRRSPGEPVAALAARDESGVLTIVASLNAGMDRQAERFVLAHLLGHVLCEIEPQAVSGDWQRRGFRETVCPHRRYAVQGSGRADRGTSDPEARADRFAAALLMPAGMVRRAHAALVDAERLAAFFGVSVACATRRLADLGLQAMAPANFLAAEALMAGTVPAAGGPAGVGHQEGAEKLDQMLSADRSFESQAMPRSFAASTYAQAERSTRAGAAPAPAAQAPATSPRTPPAPGPAPGPAAASEPGPLKGMDRIRELARRLDRTRPGST